MNIIISIGYDGPQTLYPSLPRKREHRNAAGVANWFGLADCNHLIHMTSFRVRHRESHLATPNIESAGLGKLNALQNPAPRHPTNGS